MERVDWLPRCFGCGHTPTQCQHVPGVEPEASPPDVLWRLEKAVMLYRHGRWSQRRRSLEHLPSAHVEEEDSMDVGTFMKLVVVGHCVHVRPDSVRPCILGSSQHAPGTGYQGLDVQARP
jgi:hypothetical protein